MKAKQLTPQLRFPEFDREWEEKKLGEISSKVAYGMNSAAIAFDGKHKYLRITDIDENTREFISDSVTSPDGLIEEKFKMKLNDIVFARTGASTGKSYLYNPKDGDLYFAGFLIKFNISKADSYFVYSQTFRESYRKWVQVFSMRSGQPGLNAEEYKDLKINLPTLPEQQKIATFLTAVDAKLQQLSTKKELLEQYKKGVMQQLFSQQLRFKQDDGSDFGDWEEKKLGDVGKIRMCKRVFSNETSETGDIPFYKIGTFGKVADAFIKEEHYLDYKKRFSFPKIGEILISAAGTLGRTVVYDGSPAYFQDSNIVWIENDEKVVTNSFLYFIYQIVKYDSEGGTIQRLYNNIINKAKFLRPSLEEQQKIASYLSALDAKIETVQTQLEKTQQFKKGLLQVMFV